MCRFLASTFCSSLLCAVTISLEFCILSDKYESPEFASETLGCCVSLILLNENKFLYELFICTLEVASKYTAGEIQRTHGILYSENSMNVVLSLALVLNDSLWFDLDLPT